MSEPITPCPACERLGPEGPCFKHRPGYRPAPTLPPPPVSVHTERTRPHTARPWWITATVLVVLGIVINREPTRSPVAVVLGGLCIGGAVVCLAGAIVITVRSKR